MLKRWAGTLMTALILGGVALIVVLNLDLKGTATTSTSTPVPAPSEPAPAPLGKAPAGFREYPIGEPQFRHELQVAAVWLPPLEMEGMAGPSHSDVIHLEADIHATEGNRNGFGKDEFVPYLKIGYKIVPAVGGAPVQQGDLLPMVARDGLHYGASVAMPKAGHYTLIYDVQPPSAGGLGRHSDPATGVASWWGPFEVKYDWDYSGPPAR